ncbi:hypothetical protein B566_EDAN006841 [Ephemera danica]|nr:hypothetical protein B566_EDAN006841 [Ephemera danica]
MMLLFQQTDGTTHLHTGDFRASPHMESYSVFWNNIDVDTLFLDTTYCNEKYDFPTQEDVLQCVVEQVDKHASQSNSRVLFLCGSYTIGKEKVFRAVAEHIGSKIWSKPRKLKILHELRDPKLTSLLTNNSKEAAVHVVPMHDINFQSLQRYLQSMRFHFSEVVAFRPTGWQYSQRNTLMYSLETRDKVSIYSLPYSEHSSFLELQRFVKFLKPEKVVVTVKTKGKTWEEIASVCNTWARIARGKKPKPSFH